MSLHRSPSRQYSWATPTVTPQTSRAAAPPTRTAHLLQGAVIWLAGAFLLFQWFGLPVLAVGPSWALWQTVPDLLLWAALGAAALYQRPVGRAQVGVWRGLLGLGAGCVLAFALLFWMRDGHLGVAVPFGLFQLFKLIQILGLFWVVSRLPLSRALLARWHTAVLISFVITVVTVAWTYFSPALPTLLGQVLPHGLGISGPWESYYLHNEKGLGAIGYNHAHVAAMVLLQAALLGILRPGRSQMWVLVAALLACFLSGARAGLVGCLLFVVLESVRMPLRASLSLALLVLAGLVVLPSLQGDLGGLIARQSTLLDAGDASNLAGRADIWRVYLDALLADPARMLIGSGFGSGVANNGANAHTLILQVVYETGLAGLSVLLIFFVVLIMRLRALGTRAAGIALNLLAGLWLTALTTETFYPVPALGSFLPLLALALAVALLPRESSTSLHTQEATS
ncbi:O-antigen ligase family protein [Deinococcus frigens]|uniref:O-antigen ligase family protein n=1 Tax=Deinococcus frigens TaxID=249403 RepID=UPI000496801B|nr:O-antigen ligase family protein [Deinococcus frigens]